MRTKRKEGQKKRALAIGLDARMIAHSGIGMRIRGLLKYLGPIALKENFQIYLFGDVTTILNEGILCYEFSDFEKNRSETETSDNSSKKEKDFSYPVIRYRSPIYSLSEFLGHPLMGRMDLLDIPHFNAPLRYLRKSIVTIHDIIPFRMKEFHSSFLKRIYMQVVFRLLRRFSKKIVSVSEYTAKDLEFVFGFSKEEIKVIHNGVDRSVFYPATPTEKKKFLKKYELKEGYLLSVGIGKGHKNLNFVLNALKPLWDSKILKTKWVLGGVSGKIPDYLQADIMGYENRILPMERLSLNELRCLYSCAGLFIFPSKYEGFGFPPLEAQACGRPVVSSDTTVMPEILRDSVYYFSPNKPEELQSLLRDFSKNRNIVKNLIIKGKKNSARFSWEKAALEILEVYKSLS
ncbi:glycosyltransferase family 4 protein [Leptospira weilii]|uniref:Glycosyltransferase, group 1 family protein n=1 Tax=Leptospira weilii str. UI 13098 TaxID=1088542 RepID=M6PYZ1_9LEPT|nr:glycosyltransferase family 1 protein [Leptospira weilii]EMN45743.1 glycosyltransferase, group 1 family protein [Leptospira weilii str. LNT 1234]EMN88299.1 glycosyltransferase, group 1 family protein [Leptospira weilii str. UI 13098]OMI17199.1 glycosyl transferase [Leptospira weilii serovar Heyan]